MPYDLHCPCIPSDPNYRFSSNRREEMPIFTTGQDAESPLLPHGSAGSPTVSQNRSRSKMHFNLLHNLSTSKFVLDFVRRGISILKLTIHHLPFFLMLCSSGLLYSP